MANEFHAESERREVWPLAVQNPWALPGLAWFVPGAPWARAQTHFAGAHAELGFDPRVSGNVTVVWVSDVHVNVLPAVGLTTALT